mmetsp:Transcript_2945/g.3248  ORF Transcript_2945/g.3248 Transcript_2945/m.3248 type:complete len:255 (+) Transcript_2945:46-810(+)
MFTSTICGQAVMRPLKQYRITDRIRMMSEELSPSTAVKSKLGVKESPDSEWPEAWLMTNNLKDRKAENRMMPNIPIGAAVLRQIGLSYWKMDAEKYTYPTTSVPWNPNNSMDPKLSQIRNDRGYSYADIITIHPDHLIGYEEKINSFFKEHIHDAEEIRYVVGGSGYFDVRDKEDRWVRIRFKKGDLMALPEGIYHRFTKDSTNIIHLMRLFIGHPIWTSFNRPCEEHPSRKKYVEQYRNNESSRNGVDQSRSS